jgi:hypothetical protein
LRSVPLDVTWVTGGSRHVHRFVWTAAIAIALTANATAAYAQGADAGAAESLFQSGKSLLEQRNYALACPKLAESYRIDPGTGTLLALALCHEGEGRLASAWGEFSEVVARSRRERRPDREDLAHQRMTALESRLPMLTIAVAPGAETIDGLEIKRDGIVVGSGSWATPVPVDPGHHHVEAAAPGRKPFAATVSVGTDADRQVVVVPVLERDEERRDAPIADSTTSGRGSLRQTGWAFGAAGVVGLAVGGAFGVRAMTLTSESKNDCDAASVCGPAGFAARNDARTAGTVSTVAFIAGGALLATGVTILIAGRTRAARSMAVRAAPIVSQRGLGVEFEGAF